MPAPIKICPTCGAQNAATAARCGCGAFLIGVDLVEPPADDAVTAAIPAAAAKNPPSPPASPGAAVCGFADCGQTNPPGTTVCVYCNRPLAPPRATARVSDGAAETAPKAEPVPDGQGAPAARRTLIRLPAALDARFEIEEPLKAAGGEADLFIVRDRARGDRAVLKLYRQGIEPRTDVLERVTRAAPDQLVRLIEHGHDEGVPYELLEYCEHGTLRNLFKGRPLPPEAARTLLAELAEAIAHLHACGIVHRDLKPENVLVRGLLPLDLVLTDFGIASVTDATMHYTSAARTLRYSAPEAGSNWVGKPTDYWALGMMLVEALTGRHPFEGLSDAVIAHWLVTRPIDLSAISDACWRELCRGLLTRDPERRWGSAEIERWLAGDATLVAAGEPDAAAGASLPPYRVGEAECRTPRELAVALAAHWTVGVKDLKRGMLRAWLQNELRDQNLARAAADAEEALEMSDDERLLRLLLRLDPGLPPTFKGYDVSVPGLAALTRKALEDHNEARQLVGEIIDRHLLSLFPGSRLQEIEASFEHACSEFEQALERGLKAGAPRTLVPDGREWQLRMLLYALDAAPDLAEGLRAAAHRVGAGAAQRSPWYRALGEIERATPATLAAMILLGPAAAQAGMQTERDAARRQLKAVSVTIDSCPALAESHAEARVRLAATIESSHDEAEILGLSAAITALAQSVERSLAHLMHEEIFESRSLSDATRVQALRERIGAWAAWRAGENWRSFGAQIEIVQVCERRLYRVELGTQIETRRVPYQYGAADIARMPEQARATLADVWSCEMPALPQFGADVKLAEPQPLRCPRCGATGRAELQEAWGTLAYPFSTTFACNDKVGVQCQTRMGRASADLAVAGVPDIVTDFIAAHALEAPDAGRMLAVEAPRIPARWIEPMHDGAVSAACADMLKAAAAELRPDERISAQRLGLRWSGVVEVGYRYQGKDYRIWIPEREDATPIALDHPLAAMTPAADQPPAEPDPVAQATTPNEADATSREPVLSPHVPARAPVVDRARASPGWVRSLGIWLAIFVVLGCVATWIVNWKP